MAELIVDKNFIDLGKKLELADKLAPNKVYKGLDKIGNKIKRGAKAASPDGKPKIIKGKRQPAKKKLKNRWKATMTEKDYSNEYVKKVYSKAPHYHLVERGHNVVARRADARNSKFGAQYRVKESSGKTFVEGSYFFDKYMDSIDSDIDSDIDKMFDKIFEDIGL